MNILFITGMIPFPLDNGRNIRTYNLIRKLSEGNSLTLLVTEEKNPDIHKISEMEKFCGDIKIVPYKQLSGARLFFRLVLSIFRNEPFAIFKRFSKDVQREIDSFLNNKQVDVVICDRLTETLYILNKHVKAIKVYSTHNIENMLVRRFFESTGNFFKKIPSYIEWKKMANYEKLVWGNFDFSIAVSENDKKIIGEFISGERIFVVPNGIDTEYFQSKVNSRIPFSIIYTGQMGWYPNEDSVLYFLEEIFPLIKNKIPNVKFSIVGSNTSKRIQRLNGGNNGIEITGRVEDIREYIDKSAAYIVPLRIGSGTRIKILEALSMEKPVISTSVGCEGLDLRDGENIIIADKAPDFAEKVVSLLEDEAACRKLGEAGRKLVKEKYDWSVVYRELDRVNSRLESALRDRV